MFLFSFILILKFKKYYSFDFIIAVLTIENLGLKINFFNFLSKLLCEIALKGSRRIKFTNFEFKKFSVNTNVYNNYNKKYLPIEIFIQFFHNQIQIV